jgi:hypothetical protein
VISNKLENKFEKYQIPSVELPFLIKMYTIIGLVTAEPNIIPSKHEQCFADIHAHAHLEMLITCKENNFQQEVEVIQILILKSPSSPFLEVINKNDCSQFVHVCCVCLNLGDICSLFFLGSKQIEPYLHDLTDLVRLFIHIM